MNFHLSTPLLSTYNQNTYINLVFLTRHVYVIIFTHAFYFCFASAYFEFYIWSIKMRGETLNSHF